MAGNTVPVQAVQNITNRQPMPAKAPESLNRMWASDVYTLSKMKDWALFNGVFYYAHVFYPLTNAMAEKHDSFAVYQIAAGAMPRWISPIGSKPTLMAIDTPSVLILW